MNDSDYSKKLYALRILIIKSSVWVFLYYFLKGTFLFDHSLTTRKCQIDEYNTLYRYTFLGGFKYLTSLMYKTSKKPKEMRL